MRNFVLPILTLLATVCDFTSAVNKCLVDGSEDKCQFDDGSTNLLLFSCGITDTDSEDVKTCINNFGGDSITYLSLDSNQLTTLDVGIFDSLTALTDLNLRANALTTLDVGIFDSLTSLTTLDLGGNPLETLPAGIFDSLTSLTELDLGLNPLETLPAGIFDSLTSLTELNLGANALKTLPAGIFDNLTALTELILNTNQLTTLDVGIFDDLTALTTLRLYRNELPTLDVGIFDNLTALTHLSLYNNLLTTLDVGIFDSLTALTTLWLDDNQLTTLPAGIFDNLTALTDLSLFENALATLPAGIFDDLTSLTTLNLGANALTTLPVGIFDSLMALDELDLTGNALECVPSASTTPEVDNGIDECECTTDMQCDAGEICCPDTGFCSVEDFATGACGDPHMTGFLGQKFDFVGQDGEWYSVVSDMPDLQVNMRVTSPVTAEPEITYITGLGIKTIDSEGLDHTIVITVTDPHSLDTACSMEGSPCLADGALTVELDGRVALLSPGEVNPGPNLAISAANLPGACRSFGFEKYWERKKTEYAANGRKLDTFSQMRMSDWILGDPTATNMAECTEYVLDATADDGAGLFDHESEHTSFQIATPKGSIRLSHGRLHQVATRDPTDRFDIPDHLTWQMNLAFDNVDLSPDATGILGETQQYTLDANGNRIMKGMSAIRGSQEDYLVEGPLDTVFAAAGNHP